MTPAGAWDVAGFCGGSCYDYLAVIVVGLVLLLAGSCAVHTVRPSPEPDRTEYSLPLAAQNSDMFCAETLGAYRPCRPVGEVRLFLLSLRAQP